MSKHHIHHGTEDGAENKAPDVQEAGQNAATDADKGVDSAAKDTEAVANGAQNSAEKAESAQNKAEQASELSPEGKIAELEAKSADLAAQLAETRDQLLRKAADFENYRKRMNQEKQNAIEYANQSLLLDIIPIIDDFERAILSAENSGNFAGLLDGIKMIEKRLTSQLESKWSLKRFNSVGEPFDPNLHEALMVEKSPDVTEAVVTEDLIKGYLLKDRVIRAAKVKVTMPEEAGAGSKE